MHQTVDLRSVKGQKCARSKTADSPRDRIIITEISSPSPIINDHIHFILFYFFTHLRRLPCVPRTTRSHKKKKSLGCRDQPGYRFRDYRYLFVLRTTIKVLASFPSPPRPLRPHLKYYHSRVALLKPSVYSEPYPPPPLNHERKDTNREAKPASGGGGGMVGW